ncbi:YsnF/AvaK domain-containing protein [Rhodocytophaga aerolata]|uniref:YsnF/AvaK domain-containing protein n=1 Tax=Rhodocytophaga aerolata TaxID=455078 RepID=A0ABT8R8M3_9BACT|nr:YsnF/AvaK domain-containing protein [Rhodocytophaga aerolata]MDO1448046.1 YsnF/AvaK domain-containing protein [Rhodocytophaga aerolata]
MNPTTDSNRDSEYGSRPLDTHDSQQSMVIPVIEEQARIEKQVIESGVVRVSKKVHEENVMVDVPLIHEEHEVERVEINQYVDTPPSIRHDGATMIIPVLREEVVIQKKLVLVEEIRITKKLVQTKKQEEVTLRKEEVTVDREVINRTEANSPRIQ